MRPNLFIVGAAKSGTTSLYEYLIGHPEVYMSPVKEPMYFSPDIRGGPRLKYQYPEDEERYVALFAEARDEKVVGEASTRYIYSSEAPGLIHEFQPTARIVAMFRNPIDMIYAMHNERVAQGEESLTDFEEALAADQARLQGIGLPPGSNELGATYRPRARFAEQLERWLGRFDREQVHVIIFEDFSIDTAGEFRRLLEFLEVDPTYQPEAFAVHNPSHRRRGGLTRALLRSRLGQWVAHGLLPAAIGENRASLLARRYRHSRLNRLPNPRPPLRPQLRAQLEDEFASEVARLSELVGRDLTREWFGRAGTRSSDERALVPS